MDVKALQWELAAFVAERGLESRHSPKSLAMALVGEGGTLLDLFKWLSEEESRQIGRQEREAAAEAIAEIFLHALRLADELGIDVEDAVAKKSAKLAGKAPPDRRPEASRAPPPPPERRPEAPRAPPPPPAPSPERQLKSATRPVPLAGPPSIRPPSRAASAAPDLPRTRLVTPAAPARPPASAPPPRTAAPPPPPRPAPAARPAAPPPPPPEPPAEVDPYADLDLEAVSELVKSLAKRMDAAQSEDPLVRELHDELGTLRRTLYSKTFKRAWVGASLKNVRTMLGAALNEDIGEEIRAKEHVAQIDRILKD
jgi:NTP pyrophosphatase (non-canonical NTP hydrolase)